MGGMSSEHEVSLSTGENVIEYLDKEKYNIIPIIINKKGDWLVRGKPAYGWSAAGRKKTIDEALKGVDVVFNALHGEYGEDGRIQGFLDCFGVPYTGSGVLASALGMDKIKSYELFRLHGLNVPKGVILKKKNKFVNMFSKKLVVKPSCLGSSVGISIVSDKKNLKKAIDKAFERCDVVIVEEYIDGLEVTCGIIDNIRGQKHFALPVTEIIPPDGHFFEYEIKYDGSTQEITPARISKELTKKIQEQSIEAHRLLDCEGYSRVDFILKDNKKPYILEVNTLPGLTSESLLPKAAKEAGIEFSKLLDIIIKNAHGAFV